MTIKRYQIRYADRPWAPGAKPYPKKRARSTHAVRHNDTLYVRGQVADDPSGGITEQTRQVLKRIDGLLKEAGTNRSKIVWANIWLADIRDIDAHNDVWDRWIDPKNPPARAAVEARLVGPEYKVEIAVVAALD